MVPGLVCRPQARQHKQNVRRIQINKHLTGGSSRMWACVFVCIRVCVVSNVGPFVRPFIRPSVLPAVHRSIGIETNATAHWACL